MTEQRQLPDIKKVKQTSTKIPEICNRVDANILILDDIIAQLVEGIRQQPIYRYRLKRAKSFLNLNQEKLEVVETHHE